jgi:hypothetical protein
MLQENNERYTGKNYGHGIVMVAMHGNEAALAKCMQTCMGAVMAATAG